MINEDSDLDDEDDDDDEDDSVDSELIQLVLEEENKRKQSQKKVNFEKQEKLVKFEKEIESKNFDSSLGVINKKRKRIELDEDNNKNL